MNTAVAAHPVPLRGLSYPLDLDMKLVARTFGARYARARAQLPATPRFQRSIPSAHLRAQHAKSAPPRACSEGSVSPREGSSETDRRTRYSVSTEGVSTDGRRSVTFDLQSAGTTVYFESVQGVLSDALLDLYAQSPASSVSSETEADDGASEDGRAPAEAAEAARPPSLHEEGWY